ncbi:hypothetical protein [Pseudoblastomonas halimionae]|uniref:hypothetical protein n=1 Tax=Alteriqipengyuania halimionae TaxID=1926630 RepID=UPI001F15DD0C|nr:hypothetical protein [Alteriqipengyuania halimionae]
MNSLENLPGIGEVVERALTGANEGMATGFSCPGRSSASLVAGGGKPAYSARHARSHGFAEQEIERP